MCKLITKLASILHPEACLESLLIVSIKHPSASAKPVTNQGESINSLLIVVLEIVFNSDFVDGALDFGAVEKSCV